MDDSSWVYDSLAAHLDALPAGFPRTASGVEMRILKMLFTPEEAALAQLISRKPETPEEIAARTSKSVASFAAKLEGMSKKGLIFRIRRGHQVQYMAAQFLIGIWEYHVNDLSTELINAMKEYLPYFFDYSYKLSTPQLRTVPIPKSLPSEQVIMPYEEARTILQAQEKIAVAPCICRKEHRISGKGCSNPLETCLVFGTVAAFYEENGLARSVNLAKAFKILDEAQECGLIIQPSNCQKVVNICLCCGCCCQILKNLKRLPNPAHHVASNYCAAVSKDRCVACGVCQERCQMDAVRLHQEFAEIFPERCIGCGLCVPSCPENAIRLESKPEVERNIPPSHFMQTYSRILKERTASCRTE